MLAPGALANFLTLKSGGSPNADNIASLYDIILVLAVIVAVVVEGALLYSVFRFRAKKSPVAAQIHGNTRLEIGWTVGAALILVVITVVTFIKLGGIINPPNSDANGLLSASLGQPQPPNGHKLTICVQGRQYIWRYTYGNELPEQRLHRQAAVLLQRHGGAGAHDGRAGDPGQRRHPLLVGAVARRQGRRRARLHDLHLVQGSAPRLRSTAASAPSCAAASTPP